MQSGGDYEVLASKSLQCPVGSHLEYLPWGKSGLRAVCLMEHGPIAIAEGGHVVIEGQYAMGKQTGEWRWLDASGKITRTESRGDAKP
jgi:hypothetical protein